MNANDSIWPLLVGLVLSVWLHLGAAVGWTHLQQGDRLERSAAGPDLVVAPMAVGSPRQAGRPVALRAAVVNLGRAVDKPFAVGLEIDGRPTDRFVVNSPLGPGQRYEQVLTVRVERAGLHRLVLRADVDGQVAESDESNNRREETWWWLEADRPDDNATEGGASAVDLSVQMLDVPGPRQVGKPARVVFELANLGSGHSGPFDCLLLVDHKPAAVVAVPQGLAADRQVVLEQTVTVHSPGEHDLTVIADPDDRLAEPDEQNNEMTARFTWQAGPSVGGQRDQMVINMISRDEYERQIRSPHTQSFDQPVAQMSTEPTESAPVRIIDPTPPMARRPAEQAMPARPASPAPSLPAATPTPPAHTPETASTWPADPDRPPRAQPLDLPPAIRPTERPQPADLAVARPVQPSPIEPANPPADRHALLLSPRPTDRPLADRSPFLPMADRPLVQRFNRPVPPSPDHPADLLEPSPWDQPGPPQVTAAALPVEPLADPPSQSLAMAAEPVDTPQLPAVPVKLQGPSDRPARLTEPAGGRPTGRPDAVPADPTDRPPAQASPSPPAPAAQPTPAAGQQDQPTSAPRQDLEAEPVSIVEGLKVQAGNVLTVQGVKILTVAPRLSLVARYTTAPRDPIVRLTFDQTGKVIAADLLRSTGYPNVDGPILTCLYKWTAQGKLPRRFVLDKLRIILGVLPE